MSHLISILLISSPSELISSYTQQEFLPHKCILNTIPPSDSPVTKLPMHFIHLYTNQISVSCLISIYHSVFPLINSPSNLIIKLQLYTSDLLPNKCIFKTPPPPLQFEDMQDQPNWHNFTHSHCHFSPHSTLTVCVSSETRFLTKVSLSSLRGAP